MLLCVAFAGPAGPSFFLPIPSFSQRLLSEWRRNQLSLTWGWPTPPDSLTTGSHASNRACDEPPWCPFPYLAFKTAHRATRGKFGFSSQNEFTPPPKGGGAGYRLSWVCWVCLARSKLAHAGPTGPVWGFGGVVPLPGSQNRTQGHTGPSLVFIVFSWCALGLAGLTSPSPVCNSAPLEWAGW